jgi:carbonic anhydrase
MRFETSRRYFGRTIPALTTSLALFACGGSASPPATTAATTAAKPAHFSYADAEGPEHWGDLDPSFALCKTGKKQSPIALPSVLRTDSLSFARPTYAPIPLVILNNGHALQVKNTAAASVTIDSVKYDLAQFHFHSPSEHTIGGKSFDLEMHLVHKSADGKTVVVALMFTKGRKNELLDSIWNAAPTTVSDTPTTVPNVTIDVASLFPADLKFEHYEGSLTVPPCTEGVSWFVVEPPAQGGLEVSDDQLARYRTLMHGPTNRPVQPLNDRAVVEIGAQSR